MNLEEALKANRSLAQENQALRNAQNQRAVDLVIQLNLGLGVLIDQATIHNNPAAKQVLGELANRLRALPTAIAGIFTPNHV